MKKMIVLLALALAISPAFAGNDNANQCGNNGNNCNPTGGAATATGGDAYANGGTSIAGAAAGALAGAAAGSSSSVGDVTNVAAGGRGGDGGSALALGGAGGKGGDAQQGQAQGQHQSNVGVNTQGQSSSTSTEQHQAATATNAGNSQNVGGQSTNIKFEDVANAPPVFLGNLSATMSCSGGFNAGGSSQDGSGALGFTWISGDCRSVVAAEKFRELGMVDTACKILKTTKGFKRAAKADPSLADVSCSIAK